MSAVEHEREKNGCRLQDRWLIRVRSAFGQESSVKLCTGYAGCFYLRVLQVVFRVICLNDTNRRQTKVVVSSSGPLGREAPDVAQRGNQSGLGGGKTGCPKDPSSRPDNFGMRVEVGVVNSQVRNKMQHKNMKAREEFGRAVSGKEGRR